MGIEVQFAQVISVLCDSSSLIPACGNAGVILPLVEQLNVLCALPVDNLEGEMLVDLGDVPTVHN